MKKRNIFKRKRMKKIAVLIICILNIPANAQMIVVKQKQAMDIIGLYYFDFKTATYSSRDENKEKTAQQKSIKCTGNYTIIWGETTLISWDTYTNSMESSIVYPCNEILNTTSIEIDFKNSLSEIAV